MGCGILSPLHFGLSLLIHPEYSETIKEVSVVGISQEEPIPVLMHSPTVWLVMVRYPLRAYM